MYEDYLKPIFWGVLIFGLTGVPALLLAKATFVAAVFENKYYLIALPFDLAAWILTSLLLIRLAERRFRRR
jgi:hypothetical protein